MVEIKAPREIKFRAFQNDKEVKRMLYPKDLVGYADLLFIGKSNDTMQPLYSGTYQAYVPPQRFFLMQYTGLKDSRGKDIYEGDIVKQDNGHVWSVGWSNEIGAFILHTNNPHIIKSPAWLDLEVIGNVYQNPELLPKGS